jgi:hypothetical protein
MIMCSADDTSGENIGGSDAGGEGPGRDPLNLTPYLALVISTYGATKSFLATAVAAVIVVIAAIMNRRQRVPETGPRSSRNSVSAPNTRPPAETYIAKATQYFPHPSEEMEIVHWPTSIPQNPQRLSRHRQVSLTLSYGRRPLRNSSVPNTLPWS